MKSFKEILNARTPSVSTIARKHKISRDEVEAALKIGIEHEYEHTKHEAAAREIALDHIGEDPKYYEKLKKVE